MWNMCQPQAYCCMQIVMSFDEEGNNPYPLKDGFREDDVCQLFLLQQFNISQSNLLESEVTMILM